MDGNEAWDKFNQLVFNHTNQYLDKPQEIVFMGIWKGKKYGDMALDSGYTAGHIRKIASNKLFPITKEIFGADVNQSNFKTTLELLLEDSRFRENLESCQSDTQTDDGGVSDSLSLYIEPEKLQSWYSKIAEPGVLIRIKAPQKMGKTLLVNRLLEKTKQQGYQTAYIDVLDADKESCENSDRLLQWFCQSAGLELGVSEDKLQGLWNKKNGLKSNCNKYFTDAIFPEVEKGLVLAVDNVDRIFRCATAEDFLSMLRAWFDKSKAKKKWSKLRLIVAHATECYVPMNLHQSPFNVGDDISLSEFSFEQVKEFVGRHGVSLNDEEIGRLIEKIGGHPFLVDRAIASLKDNPGSLDELLGKAATLQGIYKNHLLKVWGYVWEREELVTAMKEVVNGTESVALQLNLTHQLYSLGVVKLDGNKAMPRCNLYRQFFREQLGAI